MSLTSCIKKAGEFLDQQDKTKILSRARELRADGLTAKEAGRQAVDEVLESVQAELNSMGGMDAATDENEDNQGKIRAKAKVQNALADLAELLGKNTKLNMMPPEAQKKLLPILTELMDGAFELGYIKFKDAAKYALDQIRAALGKDIANDISLDNLQGAYISMATGREGADSKKAVINIEDKAEIESHTAKAYNPDQEQSNVPSPNTSVERDSGKPATKPAVVRPVQDGLRGTDQGAQTNREEAGDAGRGLDSDSGVPTDSSVIGGERGGIFLHRDDREARLAQQSAGVDIGERGGDSGNAGIQAESIPASTVDKAAQASPERRAETSVKPAPGIANIRAALPQLLPEQQDDVAKAETRFAKPDGYGMLFTNGTGTGKTFTGLGIIKRFAMNGKENTLIVVPDDKIASDWIKSGRILGLNINKLPDTKTAGSGIVITSYANLGENNALANRAWDLVVPDEAHSLMQSAQGDMTGYLQNLRAITLHPDGAYQRHKMLHPKEFAELDEINAQMAGNVSILNNDDTMKQMRDAVKAEQEKLGKRQEALQAKLKQAFDKEKAEVMASQGEKRPRVAFLSATPFAYEKTVDWANGYLFDYNEGRGDESQDFRGYNVGSNREQFFMQNFGYTMRFNKLTEPDGSKVDRGLMQRQFNSMLKQKGVLSGRMLNVDADYDRRFILVESAIGNRIDAALEWLSDKARAQSQDRAPDGVVAPNGYLMLRDTIAKKFDHLSRRYLLEAIKAQESIPIVKAHMAKGRKVVVFHDYKKGGGFHPFKISAPSADLKDKITDERMKAFNDALNDFNREFKDLVSHPFETMRSPINAYTAAIPDVMLVNGDEKPADLLKRYEQFQKDDTGPQVMLVQSAKNKGWSGHDTTGKYQRVLINLGQPTAPTLAIQQEGRIYRTGQVSDAIMRYLNTGTNWEKYAFASTIANRASAAENLGMGEQARALKDAFIQAFEESDAYPPGHEGEGKGGKERDVAINNTVSEFDRAKTFYWATQKKTSKTKASEGVDYFATPEPLGLKMVKWADPRGGEDMMEPSGGHGAIARWMPETTRRTVVEPSMSLRSRLALAMQAGEYKLIDGVFEDHNIVNKYDTIVMNPPFGSGGKTAVDHLAKAATHLRDGGRIVAIIPTGPAADKKFEKWFYDKSERKAAPLYVDPNHGPIYKGDTLTLSGFGTLQKIIVDKVDGTGSTKYVRDAKTSKDGAINIVAIVKAEPTGSRTEEFSAAEGYNLVADIKLPQVTFERAATSVATRVVIIDKGEVKGGTQKIDLSNEDDIGKFFERIEYLNVTPRAKKDVETEPEQPAAQSNVRGMLTDRASRLPEQPAKAEKPKKKAYAQGDTVNIGGKDFAITVHVVASTGKKKIGVVMDSREEAAKYSDRPFKSASNGGKWFVDQYYFPKDDPKQPGFTITPAMREKAAGGLPLFTQPSRPLMNFRKLTGNASASTAKADAEAILGMPSPVQVLTEANYELAEKRVPMWYDLNKKAIYYNTAYKGHDRARDAQWMTEEIMHAVDHIDGTATISASSETLRKGGELRTELEAAVKRGGALYDILRYPLDMQQEFTEDRIVAELFARTAVVYNGFPDLLRAAAPKTYEVFHGFFQRRNEAVQNQARRDSAVRGEESGGLGADQASSTRADGAGQTSAKLARFRDEIAAGIGGKREGRRAILGGLTLSSSQAASRGTNTAMANRNDVVGNQGGRSADDISPGVQSKMVAAYNEELKRDGGDVPPGYYYREVDKKFIESYADIDDLPENIQAVLNRGETVIDWGTDSDGGYWLKSKAPTEEEYFADARRYENWPGPVKSIDQIFANANLNEFAANAAFRELAKSEGWYIGDFGVRYTTISKDDSKGNEINLNVRISDHSRTATNPPPRSRTLHINLAPQQGNGNEYFFADDWQSAVKKMRTARVDEDGYVTFPNEPTAPDSGGAFSNPSILATVNTPAKKAARSLWFDETGRFQSAPGAAVNQWLADGIVGKALSRAMLRTASPAMRKQLRAMKLAVQDAQDKAVEVAKAAQTMSPQELAMVSDVIEQELSSGTVPPAEVLRMAAVMDTAMAQQTKELVSLGMLTAETAARWNGKYLPRYYGKNLGKTVEAAWEKAARMLTRKPSALTGIKGKHLKGRGMYASASANEVQDWLDLGYEIRDADLDASIKTAADVEGLIKSGDLKPRDEVQVWRDFTRAERDDMGEIRDASLRFTLGYMETQRDIALGRMFEAMASDPELSSKTATEQHTERVPDGTLEGSGAKRYGKLSGRYISRDDFSQLDNATGIESEMFKVYKEGLAKWKEGKTVLNPVAHFNNIVSNMSMAHFAGVSYWDTHKYIGALHDFATSAPKIKEARDAGLFLGTVSDEELRNMLPEELRKLVVQTESYGRKAGRFAFNVMALGLRKPLGAAYQAEDLFYRYLIWKDATNRGLDPEDAVDYAQKFIFDYSDLPKTARAIRDFGIPFFSYTYKFIPAFVSTALTHPTRIAAPAAVFWGLQAMAYGLLASGDEEDEGVLETIWQSVTDPVRRERAMDLAKEEGQNLPEWMKGATSIGTPRAIRLKNDEETGLPMFIDVARIVPGGDIFDVNANAGGLPMLQWLTPNNPLLTTFGAMFLNRDSFTGRDIVDKDIDTDMEAAKKRSNWLWKQWTPAIAAGNYHWERTMQAAATANGGELPAWVPDLLGGDSTGVGKDGVAVTPGRAALNTVGIKIRPIDLDRSEQMNESQKARLLREIDARVRSLQRQHKAGAISDRALDKEIDLAAEKKDRLRDGKDVDGDEK